MSQRGCNIFLLGPHVPSRGQGIVEYAIILSLLSALVLGVLAMTGRSVGDVFSQVRQAVGGEPMEVEPTVTPPEETPVPTPTPTLDQPPTPGPTPTPTPGGAFWDNFDQPCNPPPAPCPPGWQITMGRYWYLEDGWFCGGRTDGRYDQHRAFAGQSDWTNYTVTVRAVLHEPRGSGGRGFGIYFRVTLDSRGRPTGYIFQYDPAWRGGTFLYRKVVNGREHRPFAWALAPANYAWYGVEREIKIVVQGSTFTTYIDGAEVLRASDDDFHTGQMGLRVWGRSNACFDSVRVTIP